MKIGIDGSVLAIPYYCGLKNYLENLIHYLAKIDKKNKYVIFCSKKVFIPNQKNFELKLLPSLLPIFKRQIAMPLIARNMNFDIFHYPDVWGSIFLKSTKIVTTMHDWAPRFAYPPFYKSIRYTLFRKYNEFIRKYTINNSSVVIVPSNFSLNEAKKLINIKTPIKVINQGINQIFQPSIPNKKFNYFLAMADFSPRKNISGVLEAFSLFLKQTNSNVKLIIIISTEFPKSDILNKSRKLKIEKNIEVLENVSLNKLKSLYNGAISFIYPSFYEGFGLPILEAMACGCPVITSNFGAMKETAGNSALLVNPRSCESIENAISRVFKDKKLRKYLTNKGLKRVKRFSWLNTSKETLKVYNDIYKKMIFLK